MKMVTLREWFRWFTEETGEPVVKIAFDYDRVYDVTDPAVQDVLDIDFDDFFGEVEATPFIAWSRSFVLWPDDVDGLESLRWIPQTPEAHLSCLPTDLDPSCGDARTSVGADRDYSEPCRSGLRDAEEMARWQRRYIF